MANGGGVVFQSNSISSILKKRGLDPNGKVQKYIDSEVIRYMEPYMPRLTGAMIDSMIIGTDIGSGEVMVNTPYAHARSESALNNGLRGPHFFERMKADHKEDILNGAAALSGGNAKK